MVIEARIKASGAPKCPFQAHLLTTWGVVHDASCSAIGTCETMFDHFWTGFGAERFSGRLLMYMWYPYARIHLYSSTHFRSTSPFGTTTKLKHPSLTSGPSPFLSGPTAPPPAARHTSLIVIFCPTFNSLLRRVIAYTTSDPSSTYFPSVSHGCRDDVAALGGNMTARCALNVVSSTNLGTASDVVCSG